MSKSSTPTVLYGMTNEGLQYKAAAERILKKCDTAMDSCYAAPRLEMGQVFRLTFQPPPPPPPYPAKIPQDLAQSKDDLSRRDVRPPPTPQHPPPQPISPTLHPIQSATGLAPTRRMPGRLYCNGRQMFRKSPLHV